MAMEQIELLIQIQEVDRELLRQQEEEKRLPEKLKAAEQALKNAQDGLEKLHAAVVALEKKKKKEELELKVQEEHIIQLRDKLPRLKTNEEYKALLKEIETAKAKKRAQEDGLLVFMEEDEALKKEIALKETAVSEEKGRFEIQKQEIEAAISQIAVSARVVEEKSSVLSEKIEKEILEQYKNLLTVCKGLAVVPLSDHTCTGCHFSLPPQLVFQVKKGDKLLTCTYCHRILYQAQPVKKDN